MKDNLKIDFYRHLSLSAVGGFFAAYAMLCHTDMLANAQTMNLLSLTIGILDGNPMAVLLHLGSLLLYVVGTMLTVLLPHYLKLNIRILVPIVDIVTAIVLSVMPKGINGFLALYPIFFAMSMQWSAFSGARGYISSSIFSTNNTKQASLALARYITAGDRQQISKMIFYICTLLCFHIGATCSYYAVKAYGTRGAWLNIPLILISLTVILKEEKMSKPQKAEV